MTRYSAVFIVLGVLLSFLGFLPAPNIFYHEYGALFFRIAYWSLGPFCWGLAIKLEIQDIVNYSKVQDKKRGLRDWKEPSSGTETEGGSA